MRIFYHKKKQIDDSKRYSFPYYISETFITMYMSFSFYHMSQFGLLAEHGKEGLKRSVYAMTRKLMTNKVAVNFKFKGINRKGTTIKKKKIQNTLPHGLIHKVFIIYMINIKFYI